MASVEERALTIGSDGGRAHPAGSGVDESKNHRRCGRPAVDIVGDVVERARVERKARSVGGPKLDVVDYRVADDLNCRRCRVGRNHTMQVARKCRGDSRAVAGDVVSL